MKKLFNINFLFFLSLFLIFLLPPTDPDLGWHLKCGAEFWQKHTLCNLNQFSVLLPNYSWPNHYWLYQAIIFPIYQTFGFWGLTFFNALLMSTGIFLFYKTTKSNVFFLFYLFFFLFASWGVFNLGIRSQLMSFFFFSLLLFIITKARQNSAIAFFCPLLTLFWANTHGGSVILGIYLLIFFFLYSFVRHCERPRGAWQSQRSLLAITIVSFLITFLNPFSWRIYQDAFRHFSGSVDLSKIIAEWVPPTPLFQFLILTTLIVFGVFLISNRNKKNFLLFLFILPLAFLALKARRNILFYFLFFFYALTESGIFKKWSLKKDLTNSLKFSLIIFLLLVTPFISLPSSLTTNASLISYTQNSSVIYPLKAIEFLKKQPNNDPIFNRYEWGGFLIWQLPEQKIFVDGRMPAWQTPSKKSPYTIYLETLQTQPGWQKTLADYKITWLLIGPNTFMDLLLRSKPENFGWKEAYRDKIAVLYEKL